MKSNYAYLEDFINELRSNGRYAFSLQEVRNQFDQSDQAIKKHPQANEILAMHNHPLIREERFQMLMEKIEQIIN